ncbi:MAG: pilus assembly protein PilM [Candidatus Omnitrophica bacterium]|nr:pilus assembly protein PilM [Candidatus Omnitrophota bacterium]
MPPLELKIPLPKILPIIGLVSGLTHRDLVGLEFSGNVLKLAWLRLFPNKSELAALIHRDIVGLSDEDISKAIRDVLSGLNLKNPEIINPTSSHLVITKNIEIPSTNPSEIREIVNLQAARHTPYPLEEVIVDYVDIGIYKKSYTKVLLVIVARNVIKKQLTILERAGVVPTKFIFAPEGVAASLTKIFRIEHQDAPLVVVHIDDSFSDFMIILKGKVIFLRPIPIGVQHLTEEGERYQPKFTEEVKGSFEAYQAEDIERTPTTLILTGAVDNLGAIGPLLSDTLQLPVKTLSYFRDLTLTEEASKAASLIKQQSFLSVIAPLMVLPEMKVNLIPEEIKLRRAVEERGKDLIKIGILVLTIFLLTSIILVTKIYFKSAFLRGLKTKYASLHQEAKQLENDFLRVSMINLSTRGYSLEVLNELYAVTPTDIAFSSILYDGQGKCSLVGTAQSMSTIFSFVDKMEKSKYFKDVKTKYTTRRKEGKEDVVDFEIAALWKRKTP